MRRLTFYLTLFALLLLTISVHAQSTSTDAWPIVERCVPAVTKPPKDWHFNGTLLLSSYQKLHTYRQGWATPHIQVVYSENIPSSGQLSPDGKWFATIVGTRQEMNQVTAWQIHEIRIYSTQDAEKYITPWENTFFASQRLDGHTLYWLDNQHLLYSKDDKGLNEEWFVINPFTQVISPWQSKISPSQFNLIFSPDHKNALYNDWGDLFWTLTNGGHKINLPIYGLAAWSPDAARFAVYTTKPDVYQADGLAIFDLQGKLIDHIFDLPSAIDFNWDMNQTWSPDGSYLLFASDHLYLADMIGKQVVDTCIQVNNLTVSWAPSSKQFAMLDPGDSKRQVQIFDLDAWARYVVTYHTGSLIGWSAD